MSRITILVLILISGYCLFSCGTQRLSKRQEGELVEQFKYHFAILDSTSRNTMKDTVHCCHESIQFMIMNTKISSAAYITYYGRFSFTKKDLEKWKDWYYNKYGSAGSLQ